MMLGTQEHSVSDVTQGAILKKQIRRTFIRHTIGVCFREIAPFYIGVKRFIFFIFLKSFIPPILFHISLSHVLVELSQKYFFKRRKKLFLLCFLTHFMPLVSFYTP